MSNCGDCTACCQRFNITGDVWETKEKPKDKLCQFACNGCTIYKKRPKPCREFKCVWLRMKEVIADFPERLRPDNSGAIVTTSPIVNNQAGLLIDEFESGSFDLNNLRPEQIELLTQMKKLASEQEVETTLHYRDYNWKLKAINIEVEHTT